jgi:hypothetical protein
VEQEKGREASIDALRALATEVLHRPGNFPETTVLYLLGDHLLTAGRPAEAIEAMRPLRGLLTIGGNIFELAENWPRAVFVRARAYEQLRETGAALREIEGLLAAWKNADPDLPLLADARTFRARLVGVTAPEKQAIVP